MKKLIIGLMSVSLLVGCGVTSGLSQDTRQGTSSLVQETAEEVVYENKHYQSYVEPSMIKKDVESLNKKYVNVFDKYIQYIAPNNKAITIVAQDKISDEQLLKAYNVLSFYLTNHKAYDMTPVANKMAEEEAILMMPNGADGDVELAESIFTGQPLYQMEVPVTGDSWYIKNNYEHRDASYEEILHMVHDYGIGTKNQPGALPELQKSIEKAMQNALPKNKAQWGKSGLWGYDSKDWLVELSREGSLEQEYIVSVVDSYYGLWDAFKESSGGMWGIYIAKNRQEIGQKDPQGLTVLESFLPEYMTYMDRVSPSFDGTFYMTLDTGKPYTYKSQYLNNVRLTGNKNSNIVGNDRNNILIGNAGNNTIDGGSGYDVLQVSGYAWQYLYSEGVLKDTLNRDGEDILKNIEVIRFKDKEMILE